MKEIIERRLLAFGILPLLSVLEIAVQDEDYEMCSCIKSVLEEYSIGKELILSRHDKDDINLFKELFLNDHKLDDDDFVRNIPYFAAETLDAIYGNSIGFDVALKRCIDCCNFNIA